MITAIRKSFKSKAYKIILWITLLALAGVFSLPQLFKRISQGPWIVKVNGQQVPYNDYARKTAMHQEFLQNLRTQYGENTDKLLETMSLVNDPKISAMNELVQETLLDQAISKLGISINPAYIQEKLANPLFVQQELKGLVPEAALDRFGGINIPVFKMYLKRMNLTFEEFVEKVGNVIQRSFVSHLIGLAIYLPEFMIKHYYSSYFVPKKFEVLKISLDDVAKKEQDKVLSQAQLQQYYESQNAQSKRYWVPEQRSGTVWKFAQDTYSSEISDQDISNYYEKNKSKYQETPNKVVIRQIEFKVATEGDRKAVKEKAERIFKEVQKNPGTFAQVAQEMSDDKASAKKGGLLPAISRGTRDIKLEKAAFTLKSVGDISFVETSQSYAIIQLVEKISAIHKPLSAIKKDITCALKTSKFKEGFVKEMSALTQEISDPKKLEAELVKRGGSEISVKNSTRDDKQWGKQLFGLRRPLDTSAYTDKDTAYVIRLDAIHEQKLLPLSEVKDKVAQDLYKDNAVRSLKKIMQDIQQKAQGTSLKELQKIYGGTIESLGWVNLQDEQQTKELNAQGIPAPAMLQLEKVGATLTLSSEKAGLAIRLDEIKPLNMKEFLSKKNEVIKTLESQQIRLYLTGFVASLYRSATIEHNESPVSTQSEEYNTYEE